MDDGRSILDHYASLPDWLEETVKQVSEEMFFSPIKENKWSIAEIVAHLRVWDNFLLEERLPFIQNEARLEKNSVSVENTNSKAAKYANSGKSQSELIKETILERQKVVEKLQEFTPKEWEYTFYIDKYPLCLTSYIKGLVEHDHHHKLQIEVFMTEQGFEIPHSSLIRSP
ncbi:DinB family protein [Guptibacillus algicola]|uniref:DinB family protein n=1 Tax=Guptibacillus algicola TaxID=225844 RepID=UPI001CD6FC80|nr:DinB family protein [Alkalihalobacillus algicola]MCA0989047.1 DinB family protein [Alkalihalobacillus algicola]